MKISEVVEKLGMIPFTGNTAFENEIKGVYSCDLLSWVMSHAGKEYAWITVHAHVNVAAVAVMAELSCIIIPEGIKAEDATVQRAKQEGVAILGTHMDSYELCWRLHELL